MKKLMKYFRFYKTETISAPLFKLAEAFLELLIPIIVAGIVDKGIGGGDKGYILKAVLLMAVCGFTGLLFSVAGQYFSAKAAVGVAGKLREDTFEKIQNMSFSQIDKTGASAMITRMTSDVNQVQTGINLALRLFLRSPFVVLGAAVAAFMIDWKPALVFALVIPVLSAVIFAIIFITMPKYEAVQKKLDGVTKAARENVSGSRVIRAFGAENSEINNFSDKTAILERTQNAARKISAFMNPLTYIIINCAAVALIYSGALRVYSGVISQGMVIALYNYMAEILIELIKLANLIVSVSKAIACANRIEEVLNTESNLKFSNEKVEARDYIDFNNVSFRYTETGEYSLRNIDFTVKRGETVGIIGGTGSGKTTLINLLPHFYDSTEGFVAIDGKNVNSYTLLELRGKIGFVLQKANLFKGTVRDNVAWGKDDASDEEINEALCEAQADNIAGGKENGLYSEVEAGGRNFSGGQKQRLAIARALVKKPEILILDDSSSALDYATDLKLRRAIAKLNYNPTVFIVSQRTSSVINSDKIIVLDGGKAVGTGTHTELLSSCEVYKEIYYSQEKKEDSK